MLFFLRRLAAIFYDSLLLLSILLSTSFIAVLSNRGQAIPPHSPVFQALLGLLIYLFFIGFWTYPGQTVGMAAWKLKVVCLKSGQAISLKQAHLRLLYGILTFGLGLIFYERLSGTHLIKSIN